MKMPSKKIILPICTLALVAAGGIGVAQVSAASDTGAAKTSLVQKLADTFHLDKSKVQAVFDEQYQANEADRETKYEERLSEAVTAGKLTADQKTKILAEHKQLQSELDAAMKSGSMDKTARQAALDKIRTEATDWSKANSIDAKWLMIGPDGHGQHGHMDRDNDDDAPAPAPTPAS
ncbi:MAG: hypothetical protein NVSMB39_5960 [Candidatus Saccharimonadales bacterium]